MRQCLAEEGHETAWQRRVIRHSLRVMGHSLAEEGNEIQPGKGG
jgi:hypothetical protein